MTSTLSTGSRAAHSAPRCRSMAPLRVASGRKRVSRSAMSPSSALWLLRSRRLELVRDVAEDRVHVLAGEGDGADGDERDQGDEQRVLEQVLTFFTGEHRLQAGDDRENHVRFLRCAFPDAPCVFRNAITANCVDRATTLPKATGVPRLCWHPRKRPASAATWVQLARVARAPDGSIEAATQSRRRRTFVTGRANSVSTTAS